MADNFEKHRQFVQNEQNHRVWEIDLTLGNCRELVKNYGLNLEHNDTCGCDCLVAITEQGGNGEGNYSQPCDYSDHQSLLDDPNVTSIKVDLRIQACRENVWKYGLTTVNNERCSCNCINIGGDDPTGAAKKAETKAPTLFDNVKEPEKKAAPAKKAAAPKKKAAPAKKAVAPKKKAAPKKAAKKAKKAAKKAAKKVVKKVKAKKVSKPVKKAAKKPARPVKKAAKKTANKKVKKAAKKPASKKTVRKSVNKKAGKARKAAARKVNKAKKTVKKSAKKAVKKAKGKRR